LSDSVRSSPWTTNKAVIAAAIAFALFAGVVVGRFVLTPVPPAAPVAEDAPSNVLKLDADRIQAAGIRMAKVGGGDADSRIIAQATVAATPEGAAVIGARADGTITSIRKRLGDAVARGESIGTLQSREAARLTEERAAAQARLVRAEQAFARQKNLMAQGATARQDFDAAEAEWKVAHAELGRAGLAASASGLSGDGVSLDILSPVAGRITSATAVLGAYVVAGTELFRVADPARLEVQAAVPTADVRRIKPGDAAIIVAGDSEIPATVRAITPDVNLQSRAATVVLTPRDGQLLQPGQYVSARIMVEHGHNDSKTVLVPSEAIQKIEGGDAVFVHSGGAFHLRQVITGVENGGQTEVRRGLTPGEEIATVNAFLLKAEMQKGIGGDDD
jgi:cobalt-zinc-cadmium efflux system membrane fusion protein